MSNDQSDNRILQSPLKHRRNAKVKILLTVETVQSTKWLIYGQ